MLQRGDKFRTMIVFWIVMFQQLYNIQGKDDRDAQKMDENWIFNRPAYPVSKRPAKPSNDYLILSCSLDENTNLNSVDDLNAKHDDLNDAESAQSLEIGGRNPGSPRRKLASERSEADEPGVRSEYAITHASNGAKLWKLLDEYVKTSIQLKDDIFKRLQRKNYVRILSALVSSAFFTASGVVLCFVMRYKKTEQEARAMAEARQARIQPRPVALQVRIGANLNTAHTRSQCSPPGRRDISLTHSKSEESLCRNPFVCYFPAAKKPPHMTMSS